MSFEPLSPVAAEELSEQSRFAPIGLSEVQIETKFLPEQSDSEAEAESVLVVRKQDATVNAEVKKPVIAPTTPAATALVAPVVLTEAKSLPEVPVLKNYDHITDPFLKAHLEKREAQQIEHHHAKIQVVNRTPAAKTKRGGTTYNQIFRTAGLNNTHIELNSPSSARKGGHEEAFY
jgi:hypothetical protein